MIQQFGYDFGDIDETRAHIGIAAFWKYVYEILAKHPVKVLHADAASYQMFFGTACVARAIIDADEEVLTMLKAKLAEFDIYHEMYKCWF